MMKQLLTCSLLLVLFSALSCEGQASYTTVTGTLVDSSAQVWSNATVIATLRPAPNSPGLPLNNGLPITDSPQTVVTDGSGVFSLVLDDTSHITPSGATWIFNIYPNATVQNGSSVTLAVTGASQNFSGILSSILIVPTIFAAPSISRAYADNQVNAGTGGVYWNTTSNTLKGCNFVGGVCIWNTIGSISVPGNHFYVPYNNGSGGFTASTNFQFNDVTNTFNTINGNFTGNLSINTLIGIIGGTPTFSGLLTFQGNNVHTGLNTYSGNNIHNGNNVHNGNDTFNGTNTFPGTNTIKILNGILNANMFTGADIGAKINAAIASLSGACGKIIIPNGTYSVSTKITKPKCVDLNLNGSVLNFTASSLPAILVGDSNVSTSITNGAIRDGVINGSGTGTSLIGIWLGGDASGVNSPTNYSDFLETFVNLTVQNFAAGYKVGNAAYQDMWVGGIIQQNIWGIQNAGSYYSENMNMHGTQIINNSGNGLVIDAGSDFHLYGVSLDYNLGGAIQLQSGGVSIHGGNIEQASGLAINSPASSSGLVIGIFNTRLALTASSGTDPAFIYVGGTNSNLTMHGVHLTRLHTVTEVVNWQAAGTVNAAYIDFHDDAGPGMIATQAGPNIQSLIVSNPTLGTYIMPLATHMLRQNTANQIAGLSACTANTKAITYPIAFGSIPAIIVFDETTKGGANLTAKSTTGFTVSCTGATDVFDWMIVGNPN